MGGRLKEPNLPLKIGWQELSIAKRSATAQFKQKQPVVSITGKRVLLYYQLFVKIGITKAFCYNRKRFSSVKKKFGCCSKIFGCCNKNFICCP